MASTTNAAFGFDKADLNKIGLILDCDGVLLDSMGAWEKAEFDTCATVGIEPTKEDIDIVNTMTLMEACQYYFDKYGAGGSAEAVYRIIDASMMDFYGTRAVAYEGSVEFVRDLHSAGVRTCVVSSSPLRYLQAGLESCGYLPYLDGILSADELHMTKREHPIFERALEILGTEKHSTWGFDDTAYALRTLTSVGCHTIGIYSSDMNSTFETLQETAQHAYRSLGALGAQGFLRLAL